MRFSGDADVAGPVQSAGTLTPLVPLLGTAKGRESGQVADVSPSPLLWQLTKLLDCLGLFCKEATKVNSS